MLPPCDDAVPISTDEISWQALKDTADLLQLWSRAGHWGTDYASEVRWTQTNFRLCHAAPSLGDIHRLPPVELIDARLALNAAHECWLLDLRCARLYAADAIDARIASTRRLGHVWQVMRRARTENEPAAFAARRLALSELRGLIGESAYYASDWGAWLP